MQPLEPFGAALASVTPAFRWTTADTAVAARPIVYRLRLARDPQLATLFFDTTLTDAERYDLPRPLKPGQPLFWRVDATTALAITSSTGPVGPHDVPAWATPTSLSDPAGVTTPDPRPLFSWSSPEIAEPPGPFLYDLFIVRPATGATVEIAGIADTNTTPPLPLETNVAYTWSLVVHAGSDTTRVHATGTFLVLNATMPPATVLYQNFPNPFPVAGRDRTCVWFDLAAAGMVQLDILDLRGNTLRHMLPTPDFPSPLPAGRYGRGSAGGPVCDPLLSWDGTTAGGATVPAGVYLVRLRASGKNLFRRIVFRGKGP